MVFGFLRDKHLHRRAPDSPVVLLDKMTPGPVRVGTRYVEVVTMFGPFRGRIESKITEIEPNKELAEDFTGPGMSGHLAYTFLPRGDQTLLTQRESIRFGGVLRPVAPLLLRLLLTHVDARLLAIRDLLEGRAAVPGQSRGTFGTVSGVET